MEERGGLLVACNCNWCVRFYYYYLQAVDYWYSYPEAFPIPVYDQNGNQIGTANSKEEYISIWNADASNQQLGTLEGWYGPFGFKLITRSPINYPIPGLDIEKVIKVLLLTDGHGNYLQDGSNNFITTK